MTLFRNLNGTLLSTPKPKPYYQTPPPRPVRLHAKLRHFGPDDNRGKQKPTKQQRSPFSLWSRVQSSHVTKTTPSATGEYFSHASSPEKYSTHCTSTLHCTTFTSPLGLTNSPRKLCLQIQARLTTAYRSQSRKQQRQSRVGEYVSRSREQPPRHVPTGRIAFFAFSPSFSRFARLTKFLLFPIPMRCSPTGLHNRISQGMLGKPLREDH